MEATSGVTGGVHFVAVLICERHQYSVSPDADATIGMLCPGCAQEMRAKSYASQYYEAAEAYARRLGLLNKDGSVKS